MSILIAVIISLVVGFGGGWITSDAVDMKKPPKTVVNNITQVQHTVNESVQTSSQIQEQVTLTVIAGASNRIVSASYNGRTNVSASISRRTNVLKPQTNR